MADDPQFEPGTAGQVARLVAAMRELRSEAAALGASASVIGQETAVVRSELASLRGAQERSEAFVAAVVAEQTRQAQQQAQMIDALADMHDGVQACYSLLTSPPTSGGQEGELRRADPPGGQEDEQPAELTRNDPPEQEVELTSEEPEPEPEGEKRAHDRHR